MTELDHILKSLSQELDVTDLKNAYDGLSQAYRSGTKIRLQTRAMCLAYAQARMPATVAALDTVFSHLTPHQDRIKSLLDLGSGPGSVIWAAANNLNAISNATCVDQSSGLLDLGQDLLKSSPIHEKVEWKLADLEKKDIFASLAPKQTFDMITLSYVLNELQVDKIKEMLPTIWARTNAFLVLVEPGTPKGFNNIRNCRNLLIQQGAFILAPCTHGNTCPMSADDWCHFSTRLQRSKTHQSIKGTLPYEDEKFSYLIASKENLPTPNARLIKKPSQSSGLVEMDLCSDQGLTHLKVSKRQKEVYKKARKTEWGDGWEIDHS